MKYLLDTNAIIYLLKGKIKQLPISNDDDILISFITKIELLSYKGVAEEEKKIGELLSYCNILLIDDDLINKTIDIRRNHGLKLPDAIIAASAIKKGAVLITSDGGITNKMTDLNLKIMNPLTGVIY